MSTIRNLADELTIANARWNNDQGYTGKPVHKAPYWEYLAEHLLATGWNHKHTFRASNAKLKEEIQRRDEEAINTFIDLRETIEKWRDLAREMEKEMRVMAEESRCPIAIQYSMDLMDKCHAMLNPPTTS